MIRTIGRPFVRLTVESFFSSTPHSSMHSNMDMNLLMVSFVFGMVGMAMCMYGRKAGQPVPLISGAALMAVPYFIANMIVLLIVCCVLMVLPLFVHGN